MRENEKGQFEPVRSLVLATVNTGSFEFQALGTDEDDAYRALLQGWRRHCAQMRGSADFTLLRDLREDGEISFTPIVVGQVLRDGEPLLDLG